jgi:hypothetical protein
VLMIRVSSLCLTRAPPTPAGASYPPNSVFEFVEKKFQIF